MYQQTGFGQLGAPLPKDKVLSASITRGLFVPFRTGFGDFSREVRKALGRYLTFRSDVGAFLDQLLSSEPTFPQTISVQHSSLLSATPPPAEFSPTQIFATFHYTPGFKKVTRITFP